MNISFFPKLGRQLKCSAGNDISTRSSDRYTNIADAGIYLTIRMGGLEDFNINLAPIISN